MTRPIRVLLVAGSVIMVAAPAAQARTASPRTITLRAPVPAAGAPRAAPATTSSWCAHQTSASSRRRSRTTSKNSPKDTTSAQTNSAISNDTLMCAGGTLPINQPFTLNVQTYPAPTSGMGASIIAQQGGNYLNPFSISGP